jgi:hypothetical protein
MSTQPGSGGELERQFAEIAAVLRGRWARGRTRTRSGLRSAAHIAPHPGLCPDTPTCRRTASRLPGNTHSGGDPVPAPQFARASATRSVSSTSSRRARSAASAIVRRLARSPTTAISGVRERLEPARHLVDLGASVQMAKIMAKRYTEMARQIRNATFTLVDRGSRPRSREYCRWNGGTAVIIVRGRGR